MDSTQIIDKLGWFGEKFSILAQKSVVFLSELGIKLTVIQSKVLSFIFILLIIYSLAKFIEITNRLVKIVIFVLLAVLGLSVAISLF